MNVIRFEDPASFASSAGDFLMTDEAAHNLLIGITGRLEKSGWAGFSEPGLLRAVVDGDRTMAVALMTPPFPVVLSKADPEAVAMLVQDLIDEQLPGVNGPSEAADQFAEAWSKLRREKVGPVRSQRIYQLTTVVPPARVPGRLRQAVSADKPLLLDWFRGFADEAMGSDSVEAQLSDANLDRFLGAGRLYVWDVGEPVSMAAFGGDTPNGVRVSAVYTPPSSRGRGYASSCVASLSQMLLDEGRKFCFLYTDLSNPTSNKIYRQIGYEPVCDVTQHEFLPSK